MTFLLKQDQGSIPYIGSCKVAVVPGPPCSSSSEQAPMPGQQVLTDVTRAMKSDMASGNWACKLCCVLFALL